MTQLDIRFAILVCTHNGQAHLEAQLKSLAAQSFAPIAVFVHDWGSRDETVAISRRFADAHRGRFVVEIQPHAHAPGPCESFVHAIRDCLASELPFDYLMLCDQDDVWATNKLAVYAERLRSAGEVPPDLLHSDVRLVRDDGTLIADSFYGGATPFRAPLELRDAAIVLTNPVIGMTLCASRRCLQAISPDLSGAWLMHDWAIVLLALSRGFRIAYVPTPLVDYRQHAENALGAPTGWRFAARLAKARHHFSRLKDQIEILRVAGGGRWSPAVERIVLGGALQRFHAAWAACRSRLLARRARLLLACAVLVLW
jgi:glycosyltransferase involved in cell wall biosynthesis